MPDVAIYNDDYKDNVLLIILIIITTTIIIMKVMMKIKIKPASNTLIIPLILIFIKNKMLTTTRTKFEH